MLSKKHFSFCFLKLNYWSIVLKDLELLDVNLLHDLKLNIEEYATFIFSHDERLEVNLNKLKPAVVKSGASLKSFRTQTELSDYQDPTSIYNDIKGKIKFVYSFEYYVF